VRIEEDALTGLIRPDKLHPASGNFSTRCKENWLMTGRSVGIASAFGAMLVFGLIPAQAQSAVPCSEDSRVACWAG